MQDAWEGFRFSVELGDLLCRFMEASLKEDGGVGETPLHDSRVISGRTVEKGPGSLLLRKGICPAAGITEWWKKAEAGRAEPRDVHIFIFGRERKPGASWYFFNARPVFFEAAELLEEETGAVVDLLILSYDRLHYHRIGNTSPGA